MKTTLTSIGKYRVPSYLASYIAYGDKTDLTDSEIQEYNDFLDNIKSDKFELKHIAVFGYGTAHPITFNKSSE